MQKFVDPKGKRTALLRTAGKIALGTALALNLQSQEVPVLQQHYITVNSDVLKINFKEFEKEVINSRLPVVVDVSSYRCAVCGPYSAVVRKVADSKYIAGRVKFVSIDASMAENVGIIKEYSINAVPTTLIFKDGKLQTAKAGYMSKTALEDWIFRILQLRTLGSRVFY